MGVSFLLLTADQEFTDRQIPDCADKCLCQMPGDCLERGGGGHPWN